MDPLKPRVQITASVTLRNVLDALARLIDRLPAEEYCVADAEELERAARTIRYALDEARR